MSRSKWKGPVFTTTFYSKILLSKVLKNFSNKKVLRREYTIPKILLNQEVLVYNGCTFKKLNITNEKVGFKFGDFSFTRKFTLKNKNKTKK